MTRNGWYEEPTSVRNTITADIWRRVSERIRHQSNENREGLTPVLRRKKRMGRGVARNFDATRRRYANFTY